jgi:two-component system, NtrC family, sensor histidine kinase KinB
MLRFFAFRRLQTRFIVCGCLLVLTTIACGVWSADQLLKTSESMDVTLRDSQQIVDAVSSLNHSLEREDDGVLLAIDGRLSDARSVMQSDRAIEDDAFKTLQSRVTDPNEKAIEQSLGVNLQAYRKAADALVASAGTGAGTLAEYRRAVNPALRQAVADCQSLREMHFNSLVNAGIATRNTAIRATWVVAGVSLAALLLSAAISVHLTRRVVGPINVLSQSADAIRDGDFSRRVELSSSDELGRLAAGFNRMAEALSELQKFNLAQLLETKGTLEATLEALPDAVMLVDSAERISSMNRTARQVFARDGADAGVNLADLALPAAIMRVVRDALAGKTTPMSRADLKEAISVTVAGNPIKLLPLVVPIRQAQPGTFGAVLALYDVTEFAKLDELRMELIAVASHELKNPLTTLRMNILLLRESVRDLPGRQREMVANAMLGCEELGKTIDELLDLTRADSGNLHLTLDRLDLGLVVEEATKAFRLRFDEAGIRLCVEKQAPQAICRGDPARLMMVMSNVLANALKYTPAGGSVAIQISSALALAAPGGHMMQVSVTDTGPGIPSEFRERVFEKFFRVEHYRPANGKEQRGTGIGLYLCKHIVEAHGGRIWCDAGDRGSGTRISLTVPTGE